jgi:hypothetical protein
MKLSNGAQYDITHPELCIVGRTFVQFGLPDTTEELIAARVVSVLLSLSVFRKAIRDAFVEELDPQPSHPFQLAPFWQPARQRGSRHSSLAGRAAPIVDWRRICNMVIYNNTLSPAGPLI